MGMGRGPALWPWGVAAAHTTHVCSRERGAGHSVSRHPRPRRLRSSASRAPSFVLCVFCARAAACWRWVARAPPAAGAAASMVECCACVDCVEGACAYNLIVIARSNTAQTNKFPL